MGLSKQEKETIIRFDATTDKAILWSADPVIQNKIKRMKGSKLINGTYEVRIPKKCIKVGGNHL